ncbi:MAG: hypothetical protein KBT36_10785 [Kurthia sp.]|nr:hypothetical protein [Candidatus Kurthia equi]
MQFDCAKSAAKTSLRDVLDILEPLESVEFYKKIVKKKLEWLSAMKEGNYTNDVAYFQDFITNEYYQNYKIYTRLVMRDESKSIATVINQSDFIINTVKNINTGTKYSLKKTNRLRKNAFNLYQPIEQKRLPHAKTIKAFRYKKGGEKVLRPIKISKKLFENKHQLSVTNKSVYIGKFELSLYTNYAPRYFVFNPRIFSKLLQIEKKLIQLIYYQIEYIQSNETLNTLYKAYRSIPDSKFYADKKQEAGEKLNEVAPTHCDFKGELIDFMRLKKAYKHVSAAGSVFIKKHQLLFKFVLASQYIEYLDGLECGLQKVRTPKKKVKYSRREHYQAELKIRHSDADESVIVDMRETLNNFEATHANYNRLIRYELKKCRENLNTSDIKVGCSRNG